MILPDLVHARARLAGDACALLAPGGPVLTHGQLAAQTAAIATGLRRLGMGPGDRVAVVAPRGPETAVIVLATAAVAACAPLDPGGRREEVERYLAVLRPRVILLRAGLDVAARAAAAALSIPVLEMALPAGGGTPVVGSVNATSGAGGGPPAPEDIALVLPTSGTTARPKLVPLTHANLVAGASAMRCAVGLGEEDRCLDLMPLFHVHGLMALVAALAGGGSVICPPRVEAGALAEWIVGLEPTWYTAVPTIHQAVAADAAGRPAGLGRHRLRFIRSASAPLPPSLAARLEALLGVPVIEAYGMTEASHQIASNPLPPDRRKPGSVGVPTGTDVAILDRAGEPVPPGETGEIAIRGPAVATGYLEDGGLERERAAWLRTGDQGYLDPDGYLFITGRLKDLINRGGTKIAPREVEEVLEQHPAVLQAVVFPVPHPTLGEDVAAAAVLRRSGEGSGPDLRRFAARHLAGAKVPSRVLVVDEIPRSPSGKIQRTRLAEHFDLERGGRGRLRAQTPPARRSPLEEALASIWTQVLGTEPPSVHDNFFALGGDSLRAALVASRAHHVLGVDLPVRAVLDSPTVSELALVVAGHLARRMTEEHLDRLIDEVGRLSQAEAEARRDLEVTGDP